jgi:hypothetical protein
MPVSRWRRYGRQVSLFLRRFDAPSDDPIGVQVPSGGQIRPRHLAMIAAALAIAGLIVLVSAGQLGLTLALWFGAFLFLAVSRNPRRWL